MQDVYFKCLSRMKIRDPYFYLFQTMDRHALLLLGCQIQRNHGNLVYVIDLQKKLTVELELLCRFARAGSKWGHFLIDVPPQIYSSAC